MMAVPAAVRKQAEEAEKLQQAVIDSKNGGNPAPIAGDSQPAKPEPQAGPVDWEKRFKGLQTTHQTTVAELGELRQALDKAQENIESLQAQLAERQAEPAPVQRTEIEFSDEEKEEYGEGFLKMMARIAGDVAGNTAGQQVRELSGRLDSVVQHQVQSDEERYFAALDERFPQWEAVNSSQGFKDWLAEEMPMTGQQRQKFLQNAFSSFDVEATLKFFAAYTGESGGYIPESVTTPSSYQEGGEGEEIITAADIKSFYDDAAKGKYRGREEEYRRIENAIFEAQKAGRVR